MVKKNWSNPEIAELGVENTKCEEGLVGDVSTLSAQDKALFHCCPFCTNVYLSQKDLDRHIKRCHPSGIPGWPEGGGDIQVPIS